MLAYSLAHKKNRGLKVPILNHSRLIKINNKIIKLIIEIVIAIGLDITILFAVNLLVFRS